MSEDAYAEAEQIVREVGSGRRNAMPYHQSEEQYVAQYRKLVTTLAKAIEVGDHGEWARCCLQATACPHARLAWALSALRDTDDIEPAEPEHIRDVDRDLIERTTTRPTHEAEISDLEEE